MRRIGTLLTVAALMVVVLVAATGPAFAVDTGPRSSRASVPTKAITSMAVALVEKSIHEIMVRTRAATVAIATPTTLRLLYTNRVRVPLEAPQSLGAHAHTKQRAKMIAAPPLPF
jgi:hypothetical protein